jgi:RNA polymerase sigma-70 factor (ECF subfamily)
MKPDDGEAPSNPAMDTRPGVSDDAARERELVERARTGDTAAFRSLVDDHKDRAYGLALRMLRSPSDAEEVAQDSFVRAWRALPGFRADAKFSTWLHRIVVRRALDRLEVLKRRSGRETGLDAVEAMIEGGERPERAALALRMDRLLGGLSEAQRTVVTLFYYEGCSVDEVSQALRMPDGTVKTHLSRARAALRAEWIKQYGEVPEGTL